ncbi:carbohydrate esterase family 16 protein [Lentithecium fluviatile CBS 122367]|uniref:Carbohydrate esterase family 16 protein n=1 Tax=Lentithecium fluviatile CBS 122367 TaxID=1168545 RepID=A0A6G1IM04_9PLEO|nr:carbohydrate esterase family 16 protein [Lentithecium fluviatile CBS 122367]
MHFRSVLLLLSSLLLAPTHAQSQSSWPGWGGISNIFAFGDSYTTTRFQINGTQPNIDNPLGNPAFPGQTFSNGRNWIDFLTYSYNDSLIFSYNFAMGGASVDSFGVPNPFRPMDQQVRQFFLPNYAPNATDAKAKWASDNTLFTSFFGINDINTSFRTGRANMTALHTQIFATYAQLIDELYQAGARNFLFMNVPAVHRSPLLMGQGNATVESSKAAIADFNARISNMAQSFTQRRTDATVFMLDTFSLYDAVLDDPKSRSETEVYTNTTGFCFAYSARTFDEESFNSSCGIPQKQFLWLDVLHPTPPIHEAMAADIASLLRNNEFIGSSNTSNTTRPNVASPPEPTASSNLESSNSHRVVSSTTFVLVLAVIVALAF